MYDAIVVGARCAGSPVAMLLARKGYKVLLADRATFPSDKLSTHYIHQPGVDLMRQWGVLDAVIATNCPPITKFTVYNNGAPVFSPPFEGAAYCPRRYLLDKILVDAAVASGAELREAFTVDDLVREDGAVTGMVGHGRDGKRVTEAARIVVGADGLHSVVAEKAQAEKYREREALTCAYYTYWSGFDLGGAEIHMSEEGGILAFPTNDKTTCVGVGGPHELFPTFKADIEGTYMRIVEKVSPAFAELLRNGKAEERYVGTADVPNFFRKPYGPGWALVGDAGYMKDPITGFGIMDAFRDAQTLADAIDAGFSGKQQLEDALAAYQATRDAVAGPMYDFTVQLASGTMGFEAIAQAGEVRAGAPT